jgi:catechol 2,3-dioxygenase-like lactoylglutathione lyase family enzyme
MSLKRVDVVVLFVTDLERAKAFYQDALGLTVMFEDDAAAAFQLDNMQLHLLSIAGAQDLLTNEAVAAQPSAGAGSQLVAFVDDVDAAYADLTAKGVEFIRQPEDRFWGMRTAHFRDPDGHVWEISRQVARG